MHLITDREDEERIVNFVKGFLDRPPARNRVPDIGREKAEAFGWKALPLSRDFDLSKFLNFLFDSKLPSIYVVTYNGDDDFSPILYYKTGELSFSDEFFISITMNTSYVTNLRDFLIEFADGDYIVAAGKIETLENITQISFNELIIHAKNDLIVKNKEVFAVYDIIFRDLRDKYLNQVDPKK